MWPFSLRSCLMAGLWQSLIPPTAVPSFPLQVLVGPGDVTSHLYYNYFLPLVASFFLPMPAQPSSSVSDRLLHTNFGPALHSPSSHQVCVPRYWLSTYGYRASSVAGPTVWNSLPKDMRDLECSVDSYSHWRHFYLRSTSVFSTLEVCYENVLYKFTFDIDIPLCHNVTVIHVSKYVQSISGFTIILWLRYSCFLHFMKNFWNCYFICAADLPHHSPNVVFKASSLYQPESSLLTNLLMYIL